MDFRKFNVDFMKHGPISGLITGSLIIISFVSFFVQGLNLGIDFTGGTVVEVSYPEPVELDSVREALSAGGFADAQTQFFGTARSVMIRLAPQEAAGNAELSRNLLKTLQSTGDNPTLQRVEIVGPQVGGELLDKGIQALVWVLVGIMLYIYFRYEWRYAISSVVALFHDVIVVMGVFSIFQLQFDLNVLAAVLATAGYSINDTVVIFDRIRENFLKMRKATPNEVANRSIIETMSRTVITSGTTLFVCVALLFWGGEVLWGFALAMIVGIIAGTHSSVFVASFLAMKMGASKEDLIPPEKEGAELEHP